MGCSAVGSEVQSCSTRREGRRVAKGVHPSLKTRIDQTQGPPALRLKIGD